MLTNVERRQSLTRPTFPDADWCVYDKNGNRWYATRLSKRLWRAERYSYEAVGLEAFASTRYNSVMAPTLTALGQKLGGAS